MPDTNAILVARNDARMSAGGTVRNFYIFDELMGDYERFNWRTYEYERIESTTSQNYFVNNLQELTAADKVNLYINCMGGSVKEALGIHSVLQRCPAEVTAYIDGFAASAASIIAMAAKTVIMPRNTAMMIHNARWSAYGNPAELRKSADDLEVINKAAIESYTMHAGEKLPADKLQQMLDAETWLVAEDCLQYGLADKLAETDVSVDDSLAMYTRAAQATMSACKSVPAFLTGRYTPAAPAAEPKEALSGIALLLTNMLNN